MSRLGPASPRFNITTARRVYGGEKKVFYKPIAVQLDLYDTFKEENLVFTQ